MRKAYLSISPQMRWFLGKGSCEPSDESGTMRVAVLVFAFLFFISSTPAPILKFKEYPRPFLKPRAILRTRRPFRNFLLKPRAVFPPRAFGLLEPRFESEERISKERILLSLEAALANAWSEYGPKPIERAGGEFVYAFNSLDPQRSFQPMSSEWDSHVKKVPKREVMTPRAFSRFLSRYIDFEVNNQEVAESIRKFIFGSIVGFLVAGWVGLGGLIGAIPLKILLAAGRSLKSGKREKEGKLDLVLDPDWLSRLEAQMKREDGNWIKDAVTCCVFPGQGKKGKAECRFVPSSHQNPVGCLSHFLYKFSFGGTNKLRLTEQTEENLSQIASTALVSV